MAFQPASHWGFPWFLQALRSQLLAKSLGWATVLDAHRHQAVKLASPPSDNPYMRMMQQERGELPPPLGVTAAGEAPPF